MGSTAPNNGEPSCAPQNALRTEMAVSEEPHRSASHRAPWALRSCVGIPTEVFFPKASSTAKIHAAQHICADCRTLAQCAAKAPSIGPVGCVIASVWVPDSPDKATKERIRQEFARVAKTGTPAPLAPERIPQNHIPRHLDPQFQEQVLEKLHANRSWQRIAVELGCRTDTARKAFAAIAAAEPSQRPHLECER